MIGSANQANINAEKIGDFLVPILPSDEQSEVVNRIEECLKLAKETEINYNTSIKDLNNLENAILNEAFEGKPLEVHSVIMPKEKILQELADEKSKLSSLLKLERSNALTNRKAMALRASNRESIIEILEDAGGNSLTVEEVWRRSKHYKLWESDGYERFFKELESSKSKVRESRSSDGLVVTLSLETTE